MRKSLAILFVVMSIALGKSIVLTFDAPDTNISGLAWGDGKLWAVDELTDYIYCLDPASGVVEDSFYFSHPVSEFPTGLAYSETYSLVLAGTWNGGTIGYVYKYTPEGTFTGSVSMCGG